MFNITLKYSSFFNNTPLASRVAHIARDFLTCYSCLYYSSMLKAIRGHSVNTYATFSENPAFLTPVTHTYMYTSGGKNVSFSENFTYVLNE